MRRSSGRWNRIAALHESSSWVIGMKGGNVSAGQYVIVKQYQASSMGFGIHITAAVEQLRAHARPALQCALSNFTQGLCNIGDDLFEKGSSSWAAGLPAYR